MSKIRIQIITEQNHKCNRCGIDKWLDEPITLELEHKDGNNKNNSRENLEALCPNCHSLTKTWRGRNKKRTRVTDEQLIDALTNSTSIHDALKSLNLSPKGHNYVRAKGILEAHNITTKPTHKNSKLSEDSIKEVIQMRSEGLSYDSIAAHFNVSRNTIGYLIRGETYGGRGGTRTHDGLSTSD